MSNNTGQRAKNQNSTLPFIAATYAGNSATIRRNQGYVKTVEEIKSTFEELQSTPANHIQISAKFPGYDQNIRITQNLWTELMTSLTEVTITVAQKNSNPVARSVSTFTITQFLGESFTVQASLHDTVDVFRTKVHEKSGIPPNSQHLSYNGETLKDGKTLNDYNIPLGGTLSLDFYVKKPVIYLFPPTDRSNICVQVSLTGNGDFSTLYPPAPIGSTPCGNRSVKWTVDAKPDGTLFDHGTGREVSYLFWEAHTRTGFLPSPAVSRACSPVEEFSLFNPSRPLITSSNAVLLSVDKVTAYLDDVLLSLDVHTEARCSFITYWLPDLLHHHHIALRFLPQTDYEAAAPLNVTPAPDVTTRVFMVFRGVEEAELGLWAEAQAKAGTGPGIWRDIVGVDVGRLKDASLFRVLEWGGMEAK